MCSLDIEPWATDIALELLTAVAKAADTCASILLHKTIVQGLRALSTTTSRFHGQTRQSKTIATRIITLIQDVRVREALRTLRKDLKDGNKLYEEAYLFETTQQLLSIYSYVFSGPICWTTSLTWSCREHVWARDSVISTLIILAKSKNRAVLGQEAILHSMDSLFADEETTGLDELRSLVEGLADM